MEQTSIQSVLNFSSLSHLKDGSTLRQATFCFHLGENDSLKVKWNSSGDVRSTVESHSETSNADSLSWRTQQSAFFSGCSL